MTSRLICIFITNSFAYRGIVYWLSHHNPELLAGSNIRGSNTAKTPVYSASHTHCSENEVDPTPAVYDPFLFVVLYQRERCWYVLVAITQSTFHIVCIVSLQQTVPPGDVAVCPLSTV